MSASYQSRSNPPEALYSLGPRFILFGPVHEAAARAPFAWIPMEKFRDADARPDSLVKFRVPRFRPAFGVDSRCFRQVRNRGRQRRLNKESSPALQPQEARYITFVSALSKPESRLSSCSNRIGLATVAREVERGWPMAERLAV